MPVTVNFLKANDFQQFMAIPGRFFDAVQEREAKEHETLIYRTHGPCISFIRFWLTRCRVVETFERRNPATSGPVNPKVMYSSCELRIYERVGEEGWDRSRRLVITSSAYEPKPWTVSYCMVP